MYWWTHSRAVTKDENINICSFTLEVTLGTLVTLVDTVVTLAALVTLVTLELALTLVQHPHVSRCLVCVQTHETKGSHLDKEIMSINQDN